MPCYQSAMKTAFREALIRRFNASGESVADLCRGTGVSRGKVNHLLRRENNRVEVEDAIAIAHYYGMTVEEFIYGGQDDTRAALSALLLLLSPDEVKMLERQIKGVVASRGPSRKQHELK